MLDLQAVKMRGGPPNKGLKRIPEGRPGCLAGMTFIVTGVLDSLERMEAEELVKKYGGGVAKSVTRKCTHALVGDFYGATKIDEIKAKKLRILNEDLFLEILRSSAPEKNPKATSVSALTPVTTASVVVPSANAETALHGLWTDKYAPRSTGDLIGNPGPINQIKQWLTAWKSSLALPEGEKKGRGKSKAPPRAVLVSGPPGIGKTSACTLIAKELGYDTVALNASDTRNKSSLEQLLRMVGNTALPTYFSNESEASENPKKMVIRNNNLHSICVSLMFW